MPLSQGRTKPTLVISFLMIVALMTLAPVIFPFAAQASTVYQAATCSPSSSFYNMGDVLVLYINVYVADNYAVIIYKPDGSAVQYDFGYLPIGYYSFSLGYTGPPQGLRQVNLYENGVPVSTCYYSVGQSLPPGCPPYCPTITVTTTSTSTIPFDFTITASTTSVTVQAGQTASIAISVQAVGSGQAQTVTLEATSSGVSPTLNPSSGLPSPSFSSTLTVATTQSTPPGVYGIQINGRSTGGITHTATVTVTVAGPTITPTCPPGTFGTPPTCIPLQQTPCPWPYFGNQPDCILDIAPLLILVIIVILVVAAVVFVLVRRGGTRGGGQAPQQPAPGKTT